MSTKASAYRKLLSLLVLDKERLWFVASGAISTAHHAASPIGAALLDQAIFAGVGNVYRVEILHRARLHPLRSASTLWRAEFAAL